MKEISMILATFTLIMSVVNSHWIQNGLAGVDLRSASRHAMGRFSRTSLRNGLQRTSSSSSLIASRPNLYRSLQRSASESAIIVSNNQIVRSPTFLNYLCRKGKLSMAITLIEKFKVHPNLDTLNMAAYSGNKDLVKYLIEVSKIEPEVRTLVAATYSKNRDLLDYLVEDVYLIPEKSVLDAALLSGSEENYQFLKSVHVTNAFGEAYMNQLQNVAGEIAESYMDYERTKYNAHLLEIAIDNDDFDQVQKLVNENGVELDFAILDKAAKLKSNRIFNFLIESI